MAAIRTRCVKGGYHVREVTLEIECLPSARILARGNDVDGRPKRLSSHLRAVYLIAQQYTPGQ
jgi:hypothetical protein